jgi:hypothetical protein
MKNGDISNETPPRIIVTIDVVAKSELKEKKRVLLPSTNERIIVGLDRLALSHLWNVANKYGLSVELAAFSSDEWTQVQVDSFMDRLDRRGTNPFNYAEVYSDLDDFVAELPYRPNLKGVIDLPERVARYGSKGVELYNL